MSVVHISKKRRFNYVKWNTRAKNIYQLFLYIRFEPGSYFLFDFTLIKANVGYIAQLTSVVITRQMFVFRLSKFRI